MSPVPCGGEKERKKEEKSTLGLENLSLHIFHRRGILFPCTRVHFLKKRRSRHDLIPRQETLTQDDVR